MSNKLLSVLIFCEKKGTRKFYHYTYLETKLFFFVVKSEKNKGPSVMSILKVDISIKGSSFLILYSLVPKLEICLKYFLDKNSQKQPL